MANANTPSLPELFACFFRIGALSFGGGLSNWMRREVVQSRGWLDDRQFISGLALAQIAPGAGAINLTIFIGTRLRGASGAIVAFFGLMLLPVLVILGFGAFYFSYVTPLGIQGAMAGLGAAAIGFTFATGEHLSRRNVRGFRQVAVMLVTALLIGVLGLDLLPVLLVMLPVSWLAIPAARN